MAISRIPTHTKDHSLTHIKDQNLPIEKTNTNPEKGLKPTDTKNQHVPRKKD